MSEPTTAQHKQILLNAFDMNTVGHINHGLWTHPRDQSYRFNQLQYWTDLAQRLERGLFDGLFIADIIGVYDVYQNNLDVTLKEAVQLPSHDPATLVSAMAAVTEHLGFGVTINLSYEHPYQLSKRLASLDHLSQGRIAWNIVTGYLDSAERLVGNAGLKDHDSRYDQADEFLQLCYKFWEGSWQEDAVRIDKANRVFTDPSKVHAIHHQGRFYQSQGVFQVSPSIQRTPVLFQAGTSPRGLAFATRHAEAMFIGADKPEKIIQQVKTIRQLAQKNGRAANDIKIFVGISVVTAESDALAQQKFEEYQLYASDEAALAHYSSSIGHDLSKYQDQDVIPYLKTNSIVSANEKFKQQRITLADLKQQHPLGGRYPLFVGSGATVAAALIDFLDQTGIDGFNLTRTISPESHEDFIQYVIPELQQRQRYKTAYQAGSLRHKLTGQGDRLPASHLVQQFRVDAQSQQQQYFNALNQ